MQRVYLDQSNRQRFVRPSVSGAACKLSPAHEFVVRDTPRLREVIAGGLRVNRRFDDADHMVDIRSIAWRIATGQRVVVARDRTLGSDLPIRAYIKYVRRLAEEIHRSRQFRLFVHREMDAREQMERMAYES